MRDAKQKGRLSIGKEHGSRIVNRTFRKLSREDVAQIRSESKAGVKSKELATRFGVDVSTIRNVVKFKLYKE